MPANYYMFFVTALIPLVVGFVYYSNALAGRAWMKTNNFTDEDLEGGNMTVTLIIAYVLGVLISLFMSGVVIHQSGVAQMMMPDVMNSGSEAQTTFNSLMATYGDNFRTFGHGVLHGVLVGLMFVMPIIATISLFEKRGWKYVWIHTGYWVITLALIGGVLCQTLYYNPLS